MQEGKVNLTQVEQNQEFTKQTFPTNIIPLPSKGLIYNENNLLTGGTVEMKFMTAKEENILTTESYIRDNSVIDKFLQSMVIAPKFNYETLLLGDRNALLIASRIYGYGEDYEVTVTTPSGNKQKVNVNLEEIENKELDETLVTKFNNSFEYTFENKLGKYVLEFKLLTVGDQKIIDSKLKKKVAGKEDKRISTTLEQMILSVNGNTDSQYIRLFIENEFLARDSRKFREYVAEITPGPNMEIELVDEVNGEPFRTSIAIESHFFWPDTRV